MDLSPNGNSGLRALWTGDKQKGAKSQRRDSPWLIAQRPEGQVCTGGLMKEAVRDKDGEDMLNWFTGNLKAGLSLDFTL